MKTKLILLFYLGSVLQAEGQISQQFKLQVNGQKTITKDKLKIKFISIIEDSRCPEGTNCVWEGNAKIKVSIKKGGNPAETFEINTNVGVKGATYGKYAIYLTSLTPTPKANVRINRNAYMATFSIKHLSR